MNDKPMTGYQARFNPKPKPGQSIDGVELEYVPLDDNGLPVTKKKKAPYKNLSNLKYRELLDKAFLACKFPGIKLRENFADRQERKNWNTIEREIANGKMPIPWVLHCINFAERKNKDIGQMLFRNLLTYILNAEKMKDFLAQQKFEAFQQAGEIKMGIVELEQSNDTIIELN